MGKPLKSKKNKVPKISEAEYAAYVSSLKTEKPSIDKRTCEETPLAWQKRHEN